MTEISQKERLVLAFVWSMIMLAGVWVLNTKPTGYRVAVFVGLAIIGLFYPLGPKALKGRESRSQAFWLYLLQVASSIAFLVFVWLR